MRHCFFYATTMTVLATLTAVHSQEGEKGDGSKALDYFVGVWNTEATDKPAKWLPDGGKRSLKESTTKILRNRFTLSREVSQPDGGKSLWLMTYDPKTNSYPTWIFNNKGVLGGEWKGKWDESTKTLTGKAMDTPKGWTSSGSNRFADKNSNHVAFWMKDETGTLMFELEAKKVRQPAEAGDKVVAAWSIMEKTDPPPPPELKVLERLIGSWDTVAVSKPAVWTPKEVRTTSKVTRKWILDGRFVQDTSEVSDGQEGFSLMTFDPAVNKYRSWWFSSEGHSNKTAGEWNERTETMSFKADLDDGLVARSSAQFVNKDRHVWKVEIKDGGGKLYFDSEWTLTRQKE